MDEDLLIRIAEKTDWIHAGRWKEGPRAGELYIEDSEGICRIADLASLVAVIAEECAYIADNTPEQGAPDNHCETMAYATAAAIREKFKV